MKNRQPKRRPKEWTLAQVRRACPSAPTIWVALFEMHAESGTAMLTPTRKKLATATGIRKLDTISSALTVLH